MFIEKALDIAGSLIKPMSMFGSSAWNARTANLRREMARRSMRSFGATTKVPLRPASAAMLMRSMRTVLPSPRHRRCAATTSRPVPAAARSSSRLEKAIQAKAGG